MKIRSVFIFLCTLLAASIAWGRGGGGCLEEGTLIATPAGQVPVEQLVRGDAVWTVADGELLPAIIQATVEVDPAEYVEIAAAGRILRVTAEHPLQIDPGVFRAAANLRPGDTLCLRETNQFKTVQIDAIARVKAAHPAFNLLVMPGGTYLANDIVVHNKGCFLPDTPILRADGTPSPISEIRPGDELLAFTTTGEIVHTTVRQVIIHEVNEYVVVGTTADNPARDARASVLRRRRDFQNAGSLEGRRPDFCRGWRRSARTGDYQPRNSSRSDARL
jgi:hypothetical protein